MPDHRNDTSYTLSSRGRIAYFVNVYPAVSHTFIRREIEALEQLGWEVHRFSIRQENGLCDQRDLAESRCTSTLLPLRVRDLLAGLAVQLTHPARLLRAIGMSLQMSRRSERGVLRSMVCLPEAMVLHLRLVRHRIHHVHGHFGTNTAAVLRIARALGGPTYSFTNHGTAELDNAPSWSLAEKTRDAAFVGAASQYVRAQLCRFVPAELWDKLHVIRCGLSFASQEELPTAVPAERQLVCVGRLSVEKGHLVLLRAAASLVPEMPFKLILVGDGPLRGSIDSEIARLGLTGTVTLFGSADGSQVRALLDASRALVLPSLAEGLPVVLMESFRACRPVIASNVGGVAELVRPGVSGWLVTPGDEESLAAALREVLTAPESQLTQLGRAGYQAVRRQHNLMVEASKLSTLIEGAMLNTELEPIEHTAPAWRHTACVA